MILTIRQFIALSVNTVLKIIRQPLILLMTTACLVLTGLLPLVIMFDFGEEGKLIRDGALAFHFVFGLVIASSSASVAIYREIKRGAASTVLCKPVSRTSFLLATYCGVAVVLFLFSLMVMVAGLLSVRMSALWATDLCVTGLLYGAMLAAFALAAVSNIWFRRPFVSDAFLFMIPALLVALLVAGCLDQEDHFGPFGALIQWRMVPAGVLVTMALWMLASIAIALSTRLPPVFTLVCCTALFFLGLISDYLFGQARADSWFAALCYAVLPNWQDFWMIDALSGGGIIPWTYVVKAGVYAGLYLAGVLCLGLVSFRNVEIA